MKKAKLMLGTLVLTVAATTSLFAAVSGRCSRTIIVDFGDEIVSCDLVGIGLDSHGNIVECDYLC